MGDDERDCQRKTANEQFDWNCNLGSHIDTDSPHQENNVKTNVQFQRMAPLQEIGVIGRAAKEKLDPSVCLLDRTVASVRFCSKF